MNEWLDKLLYQGLSPSSKKKVNCSYKQLKEQLSNELYGVKKFQCERLLYDYIDVKFFNDKTQHMGNILVVIKGSGWGGKWRGELSVVNYMNYSQ